MYKIPGSQAPQCVRHRGVNTLFLKYLNICTLTSTIEGIFNAREKMSHLKKRRHSGQSFRIFYTKTAKTYEPIRPLSVA